METKANYVLIGAFVLLATGALALFTLWIAGNPFSRSFKDYDGQDLNIKEHQVRTSQPPNHPSHLPTALLTSLSH